MTITNYGITIPEGKKIIHSTNNYEDINKDYDVEIPLLGDSKLVLQKMIECIKSDYKEYRASDEKKEVIQHEIKKIKDEWNKEWNILLNSNMNPINPYRIVNEINKNIDHENTIVTHDAGHPRDQMMPFITATNPGSYIGWGKSTHLSLIHI